ncbi:anhydro-N-acetylmuramic acid kinase [Rickettsiales bacterium]|nr:anhydro-N-acetylmuramic acid kinase [Rickettsiales bacterium]
MKNKSLKAIGLMSGTSMDGIDVALIESDGFFLKKEDKSLFYPYLPIFKAKLRRLISNPSLESYLSIEVAKELTQFHIEAVQNFLKKYNIKSKEVDLIGFHGHTILHNPDKKITWQIGDPDLLQKETNIKVVSDLRNIDIQKGGQGAPLAPIYHHALLKEYFNDEVIFMNIGGVCNITYVTQGENNLIAGDICFGNAPMDDLIHKNTGKNFDYNGNIAKKGKVNLQLLEEFLELDFFQQKFPKSIDRNEFDFYLKKINNLSLEDALATLIDIMAQSLERSLQFLPTRPKNIIIAGGGANNNFLIERIKEVTNLQILNPKDFNINIDFVEAELFGFLAIRHVYDLPFSFAKTTGCSTIYQKNKQPH